MSGRWLLMDLGKEEPLIEVVPVEEPMPAKEPEREPQKEKEPA